MTQLMTPQEFRWALRWTGIILGVLCLPYVLVLAVVPDGWQFGGFLGNPLDSHTYLAKMRLGMEGASRMHLTYTPEPHSGAYIYVLYLALGHLTPTDSLLVWMFHLARLLSGGLLLLGAFQLIAVVTPVPAERRLAFILVATASGVGWLAAGFGFFPIDLWVPEAFTPYAIFMNPHFPLGMACMLKIFVELVKRRAVDEANLRYGVGVSVLAALVMAVALPFAVLTTWAVLSAYVAWLTLADRRLPWGEIWLTAAVGLSSAPLILYYYWISVNHPILSQWSAQNVTPAPPWWDIALGYGLVAVCALVGLWMVFRRGEGWPVRFIALWAVVTVGLVYFPYFDLQRRLITGLHVPLCILAAIGLSRGLEHLSLRYQQIITRTVMGISALGTVIVLSIPLLGLLQPPTESHTSARFFLRHDEAAALAWLRDNTHRDDVIVASPRLGQFVPSQTGARTFYGHPFETINANHKEAQVEAFYRGEVDRLSLPVDFVIYGPSEQALDSEGQFSLDGLDAVYSNDSVTVYRVNR